MPASLRLLLTDLIDYAGLFPPAALEMAPAVRNYAGYLASENAWMLGRFIVPMARLDEFEQSASELLPRGNPVYPWRLSALGSADLAADLNRIGEFNHLHARDETAGAVVVDSIELKAEKADDVYRAMRLLPRTMLAYFEIPITRDPQALTDVIAETGALAKVRTGGVTEQAFPTTDDLARFISACVSARVAFKATAGLHHPLRASYRLTYEPDSTSAVMHGFLNVFLAAAFARFGAGTEEITHLLEETSPAAFRFDEEGVTWGTRRLNQQKLLVARQSFAIAYGSCSFEEPIDDLKRIGLL
ncbi:MAG TPA: hypothetical protein VFD58_27735 [Blastocatellia bacterium]|nr:hypothetical protein [Blastocatellia bacterium]